MKLSEFLEMTESCISTNALVLGIKTDGYHICVNLCDGSRFILKVQNMPSESVKSQKRKQIIADFIKNSNN